MEFDANGHGVHTDGVHHDGCWCAACWSDTSIVESKKYHVGDSVRVVNWVGPCLNRTVAGIGRRRLKLDTGQFEHYIQCHLDPCERCVDHPKSLYPNGYTN